MKVILIDDEPLALDTLESKLNSLNDITIVETFLSIDLNENNSLIKEIDCAFIDIEMPGTNGIELAEMLLEINPGLFIVFVTAFKKYAVEAFELNATDFLLKPIYQQRVSKTIHRIKEYYNPTPKNEQHKNESTLLLNLCGDLTFNLDHHELDRVKWRTTKARELFIYLVQNHEKPIPKNELMFMLWPDFTIEKASAQLYTSIYQIRKTLKRFSDYITIKSIQDSYILIMKNVKIDIIEWEKGIESLPSLSSNSISNYEEVMNIYTDTYLEKDDFLWADSERYRTKKHGIKQLQKWLFTITIMKNSEKPRNG
ncbi:response regulator [Anaerobacillus sp. 1_MG-2023]|uniref:response regulator n=1 Tax=Anaerobacillus sp. 1_MG-2023 TaxID=3062655 RepID=UPI0026E35937|nr:response regulator [Anaerobacillus sp. 1_MG-2023]MDO6658718.1 response regulator [Anaerobacillus sp. 1_MG-2023]